MTQPGAEVVRIELPAAYRYLHILSATIAALLESIDDLDDRQAVVYSIQLAAHEVCTNIIEHAYAGRTDGRIFIGLSLMEAPRRVAIDMYDTGQPFDLSQTPEPDLSVPQTSGYGLFLIRNLVDEVSYTPERSGNRWRLIKSL